MFLKNSNNQSNLNVHWGAILWVVFFCYSICAALIFQKILVPKIFPDSTGGLLPNDSASFHYYATVLAEQISVHGWNAWSLYPNERSTGNVAILGGLYAVFGYDPALMVPINAALHALSGLMIFLISHQISSDKAVAKCAGVIAAILFVVFPSALNWYGQVHKDGFAIAGTLIILYSWLKAINNDQTLTNFTFSVFINLIGVFLVLCVRPYNVKLILLATLGVLFLFTVFTIIRSKFAKNIKVIAFFIVAVLLLIAGIKSTYLLAGGAPKVAGMGETYATWQSNNKWRWDNSPLIPDDIENYIKLAASTRAALIEYGLQEKAKSTIDQEIKPQNILEVALYLPRALQVGLLAPFPSTWLDSLSLIHIAAAVEMFIYYLCIPGVLFLMLYSRKPSVYISIYFACFFLTVYGFTTANLGTLYRLRYAYEFIILLLGLLGWFTYFNKIGYLKKWLAVIFSPKQVESIDISLTEEPPVNRKKVITSGLAVMGLTLLGFIAFFIRDILMARSFGLGMETDNFFIALLIPMFIVTVFCMPLGAALTPIYFRMVASGGTQESKRLVTNLSFKITLALLLVCAILYMALPSIFELIYPNMTDSNNQELIKVTHVALLILLLSGMLILGNSVLNALGKSVISTASQLVVPITAILALYLFGENYGVLAVVIGMIVGQFFNLLIVQYCLRHDHINLIPFPKVKLGPQESVLISQYIPLTVSAFFVAIALPISTLLAMKLPDGGVSAFNLGSKIVLFITGLVTAVVTTVMLPYFSSLIARNHLMSAKRELSFFILTSTFISVPISCVLFIWADSIVKLLFEGGAFDIEATAQVVRVMQYAIVQLPFFICSTILLKFATAARQVVLVCLIAILGLLINVGVSMILLKHMDVAGIALGSTVSVVFATVLLVLALVHCWYISRFDALVIFLNWLLFVTLLMGLHFKSITSVYSIVIAYGVLVIGYLDSLKVEGLSINWWKT